MQNNSKFTLDLEEESPSHSKEAWPADYVKSKFWVFIFFSWTNLINIIRSFNISLLKRKDFWIYYQNFLQSSAVLLGSSSAGETSRKRKNDWSQNHGGEYEGSSEAPMVKAMLKERDRRKSQGEFWGHISRGKIECAQKLKTRINRTLKEWKADKAKLQESLLI